MGLAGRLARSTAEWACVCSLLLAALGHAARAEDRALIIGINRYANLNADAQLTGAVNDATLMARTAADRWGFRPEQIKRLVNEQATAGAIREALHGWIEAGTRAGDRVFIYFSGHGYFVEDTSGDEADGRDEVLVAHDGQLLANGHENFVLDDEIEQQLTRLADRKVLLITDSCHSGTIERSLMSLMKPGELFARTPVWLPSAGMRGDPGKDLGLALKTTGSEYDKLRRASAFVEPRGVSVEARGSLLVWTAAAAAEIAQEDATLPPDARNGVFTRAFAEGLSGKADTNGDGRVSAAELLAHVRLKATAYCATNACRTGMTPTFEPGGPALGVDMTSWTAMGPAGGAGGGAAGEAVTAIPVPPGGTGVRLAIEPGNRVPLGDSIKLRIESTKPGYVIVLDVRDDGKVFQLFPSVCTHQERAIRANAPLLMPDPSYGCVFSADERGTGKIMAIVTEDKVPLDALLSKTGAKGIEVVGQPSDYLGQIAAALMAVWTGDTTNRPVKWGLAVAPYRIE